MDERNVSAIQLAAISGIGLDRIRRLRGDHAATIARARIGELARIAATFGAAVSDFWPEVDRRPSTPAVFPPRSASNQAQRTRAEIGRQARDKLMEIHRADAQLG